MNYNPNEKSAKRNPNYNPPKNNATQGKSTTSKIKNASAKQGFAKREQYNPNIHDDTRRTYYTKTPNGSVNINNTSNNAKPTTNPTKKKTKRHIGDVNQALLLKVILFSCLGAVALAIAIIVFLFFFLK